jgi:hypothetical protein
MIYVDHEPKEVQKQSAGAKDVHTLFLDFFSMFIKYEN